MYGIFDVAVPDYVAWVFTVIIILFLLLPPLLHFLYKGVTRRIVVVKCRKTVREIYDVNIMSRWRYSNTSLISHSTIDYHYQGKKFVHTANCFNDDLFAFLKPGKTYIVRIKLNTIVSIEKDI